MYGIPHGCGANLLMWRRQGHAGARLAGAPCSTEPPVQGQGHRLRRPDLHRRRRAVPQDDQARAEDHEPVRARPKQFDAAVDLLKKQRAIIGQYWSDYTKEQAAFAQGDSVLGTTWQVIANLLDGRQGAGQGDAARRRARPGWSDTWMLSSKAKHPNCMYKWMNCITSPEVQGRGRGVVRRGAGEPEGVRAHRGQDFCDTYQVTTRRTTTRSSSGRRRRGTAVTTAATVRRLLQVGPGLDGDQGLSPGAAVASVVAPPVAARRRAARGTAAGGSAACYLGSLAVLLVAAFWTLDEFSGLVVRGFSLDNFRTIFGSPCIATIVCCGRCRSRPW